MNTQTATRDIETMDSLPPYILDMIAEVESVATQAHELSKRATELEREIEEAATSYGIGACPDWCRGSGRLRFHEWRYHSARFGVLGGTFIRQHTGRKGERYVIQTEILRMDGSRELCRIQGSPRPEYIGQ